MEILESNVKDYNQREQFWINKLNTVSPNGYNLTIGGEGFPHYKGTDIYNSSLTQQEVDNIKNIDLLNPLLTIPDIAKKYNVNASVIHNISRGISYHDNTTKYPIRTKEWIYEQIYNLLITKKYNIEEIEQMVFPSKNIIKGVNQGSIYHKDNVTYPLVDFLNEEDKKVLPRKNKKNLSYIIEDLINNHDLTIDDIALKYNTTTFVINAINKGESYFNSNYNYPLRKFNKKYRLITKEELLDIVTMLQNPKYQKKDIIKKYSMGLRLLNLINNGEEGYKIDNITYPIRKYKKKKIY